jgi:hypothetical protein
MLIAGKLFFRGLMVIVFGGGILWLFIYGWHADPEIEQLLNAQGIIEFFRAQPNSITEASTAEAPLLRQAKAFAKHLNPPQARKKVTKPHRVNNKKKPVPVRPLQPSFKFKVLATSVYAARPSKSMALIWQPGGDLLWIKPGESLGHFVVDAIKHGMLVYKDGNELREIAVLSDAEQRKGPNSGHSIKLATNISHKLIKTHE